MITRIQVLIAAILLIVFSTSQFASAHSGGLNSQGCHGGSKPYHCHRSPSEMVGNRLRCDLGSRSIECAGWSNSYSAVTIIQQQLVRHCSSLSRSFIDGVYGRSTQAALVRFQYAYGLAADGVYGPATARALKGRVTGACR